MRAGNSDGREDVIYVRFGTTDAGDPITCPEFVDDGMTLRCDRCGWWRPTHEPDLHALVREAASYKSALAWLVRLKDGPRDATYEKEKPEAWAFARRVLAGD